MKIRTLALTLVVSFLISSLTCTFHFRTVQAYIEVTGIINSTTTWTKANSPYNLTGPILVNTGVTLTIEAGTTVNLNNYYIRVAGTLQAQGSNTYQIHFIGSSNTPEWSIQFTGTSTSWNEQTQTGCILENVVIDSIHTGISVRGASPKIKKNFISAFYAIDVYDCSPVISDNFINGAIGVHNGNATIIRNTIRGRILGFSNAGLTVISNNTIIGTGQGRNSVGITCSNAHVHDNIVYGFEGAGIVLDGNATIERNLIVANQKGIQVSSAGDTSVIRYNTITNNSVGIETNNSPVSIVYNNIHGNILYGVSMVGGVDIDVINNWWGTTDPEAIKRSIRDFEDDFNVGRVNFVPFLTEPNPEAPAATYFPTPPKPSASPSVSILSPINSSYSAISNNYAVVPLIFVSNASLSWVGYSLDGGSNITAVNGTLIEIGAGSRNLTLYANDTAGNWADPQTVYYSVAWNGGTPPPEPFPWLAVAAVGAAVAVGVAVVAVVYLKKRKSSEIWGKQ